VQFAHEARQLDARFPLANLRSLILATSPWTPTLAAPES
jgi:hypothetical protein